MNKIIFVNGVEHDFTNAEIYVLKMALKNFNDCDLLFRSIKESVLNDALEQLRSLFLENLD